MKAGRDLDALFFEKVIGSKVSEEERVLDYSTNISHAIAAVSQFDSWTISKTNTQDGGGGIVTRYNARFLKFGPQNSSGEASSFESPAHSVCLAALSALSAGN